MSFIFHLSSCTVHPSLYKTIGSQASSWLARTVLNNPACLSLRLGIIFFIKTLLQSFRTLFTDPFVDMTIAIASLCKGASADVTVKRLFLKMHAYMINSPAKLGEAMVTEGASTDYVEPLGRMVNLR